MSLKVWFIAGSLAAAVIGVACCDSLLDTYCEEPQKASLCTLDSKLHEYYNEYVLVKYDDMRRASQVVDEVRNYVFDCLKKHLPVCEMVKAGSTAEGLKVINPDEFDVEIHVPFDRFDIDVQDTGAVPDYVILRALNSQCTPEKFCLESGVINPQKIRSRFQSIIQKAVSKIRNFDVSLSTPGPAITATVTYDGYKQISIDFVPVFVLGNKQYVAKPNPTIKYEDKYVDEVPLSSYWRKSFTAEERQAFARFPNECVEKICLKIMKAMKENFPEQLGQFRSYHFKTAFLQFFSGKAPTEKPLSEVFIGFLKYFIDCLEKAELRHFFVRRLNLFSELKLSALEKSKNFLNRKIVKGNEGLVSLLIQRKEKAK